MQKFLVQRRRREDIVDTYNRRTHTSGALPEVHVVAEFALPAVHVWRLKRRGRLGSGIRRLLCSGRQERHIDVLCNEVCFKTIYGIFAHRHGE